MNATEKEFNRTENTKFQFLELSLSILFLMLQAADPFQGVTLVLKVKSSNKDKKRCRSGNNLSKVSREKIQTIRNTLSRITKMKKVGVGGQKRSQI